MVKYLTATNILRYIETKLGYLFEDLELDADDIISNIQQESIPVFSKKFPYMYRHLINPVTDCCPDIPNRYYLTLDDHYTVIGVNRCFLSNDLTGQDLVGMKTVNGGSGYSSQMLADIISANSCPITAMYYDEDGTLEIIPNNISNRLILVEVKCLHFNDFSTIEFTMQDQFKLLAYYDTCMALLPIRQRFSSLSTTYGNIELFLSKLEEAESKRDELLELWRKSFYKSPKRKKIYIA